MADPPNHGRDIETDILRVLAENDGQLTGPQIREALSVPAPDRAVYYRLTKFRHQGWTARRDGFGGWGGAPRWALTSEGRRVAEARGLTGRGEG